jgi:toxin-antitoxin system PIN domain toxin
MILVDANLLIYAVNKNCPQHRTARKWLEDTFSGAETVGLPWIAVLAFLRITTRPGILEHPLTGDQALAYIDEWLALPLVFLVAPGENNWSIFCNLLHAAGTFGNLTSDAHIATMAIENGATVYSADYDFRRFPGVLHINPLV